MVHLLPERRSWLDPSQAFGCGVLGRGQVASRLPGGQRAAGVVIRACLYVDDPLGAIGGRMRRREGRGEVRTN